MTLSDNGKIFVVNKMEWHILDKEPITERSEDSYLYFARVWGDSSNKTRFSTFGGYLGDYLKDVDDDGNAILSDPDIYAWSEDSIQPPMPTID